MKLKLKLGFRHLFPKIIQEKLASVLKKSFSSPEETNQCTRLSAIIVAQCQ
jgi:hypothetical protein